jgi:ribosomal protein S18 acetylase RimI-like enzyme
MNITLRAVTEADDAFLFALYASTRAAEMTLVPWNDVQKQAFLEMQFRAQKTSYAKQYPAAQHSVICLDGSPVGRLYLDRSQERFHILDVTIAEACRNRGVGSVVLKEILEEADRMQKPATIYVENFNPSVRLFERLGFRAAATKDFTVLLERQSSALISPAGAG